ncbi:PPC domain-containing protein [Thermostichus vulcanus]|uniref:PPC domain-containing protein n=1 Tax=Thermostichus vulcanus str. 'Rupite' TaxID=2813851 RepID=A0ABT0CDS8_THEVL|nr:PPC domain-containing protein [Thermostichus vulcanus]MCJ2543930.1 PPC domain-containing protein [Thermostichus vulcanus str. 'Rupite']
MRVVHLPGLGLIASCLLLGQFAASAQSFYNPIPLTAGETVESVLSSEDIPSGELGAFYRDYRITVASGSYLAVELSSEDFDTVVRLIGSDGSLVAENDDANFETTNSILVSRVEAGQDYTIRVGSFGEIGAGRFQLKVIPLRPVD